MRLTSFTDYSIRVLLYLGARGEKAHLATIGDIAGAYGISENHLSKVVHHLAKEGYIRTTRGKRGGMELARAPEEINLGKVVRSAEEDLSLVDCLPQGGPPCVILPACNLPHILANALGAFFAELDKYTLADLVRPPGPLVKILTAPSPRR